MPSRQCCNATICCADKHRNKTAKLQILFFFFFLKFKNFFFSWILMLRLIYTNKSVSCVCVRMRNVGGKKRRKGLAEREIGNHREHRSGTHTHTHTHTHTRAPAYGAKRRADETCFHSDTKQQRCVLHSRGNP